MKARRIEFSIGDSSNDNMDAVELCDLSLTSTRCIIEITLL